MECNFLSFHLKIDKKMILSKESIVKPLLKKELS